MGLLDVLNGMQNGPRGERSAGSGGMSPITMALLGLLAYKAYKNMTAGQTQPGTQGTGLGFPPASAQPGASGGGLGDLLGGLLGGGAPRPRAAPGGGLGDLLGGGLGGLLAGGAAGSVLSSGLGGLLKDLQSNGLGDAANSWVGTGPNKAVSADDLASAIGADDLDAIAGQTGMSRNELAAALSQHLPDLVNHLTPDGRLPTEQELSRMV